MSSWTGGLRRAPGELSLVVLGLVVAWMGVGCTAERPVNEVTVVGTDYAFEAPDTLPPGPTVFVLDNRGVVQHEVGMGLLKEGVTIEDALAAQQAGDDPLEATLGFVYADPEERSPGRLFVDLQPGRRYGLVCFLQDRPDAPPHTELGMHHDFVVE